MNILFGFLVCAGIEAVILWVFFSCSVGYPIFPKRTSKLLLSVVLLSTAISMIYLSWIIEFQILTGPQFSSDVPFVGAAILELHPQTLRPVIIGYPYIEYHPIGSDNLLWERVITGKRGGELIFLFADIDTDKPCVSSYQTPNGPAVQPVDFDVTQHYDETFPYLFHDYVHRTFYPIQLTVKSNSTFWVTCSLKVTPAHQSFSRRTLAFATPSGTLTLKRHFIHWDPIYPMSVSLRHEESSMDDSLTGGLPDTKDVLGHIGEASEIDRTGPILQSSWTDIKSDDDRNKLQFIAGVLAGLGGSALITMLAELLKPWGHPVGDPRHR